MLTPEEFEALTVGKWEFEDPGFALMAPYVEQALAVQPGGTGYFQVLDGLIGFDVDIHRALVDKAIEVAGHDAHVIASGEFGRLHAGWAKANRPTRCGQPLVLKGGLRYEPGPHYNQQFEDLRRRMLGVKKWVFIDDSLYLGRTMDWARNLVLMTGGEWAGAVVAYDGSRETPHGVHSLYRYFDHHPLPE